MAKILHVMSGPRAEGTPRLVLDWIATREHTHELLFMQPNGELKTVFEATGVWQYYNKSFDLKFTAAPNIVALTHRVCRERQPDIVISWAMGFSQWIHLGARLAGVTRLIVHAGNPPGTKFLGRYVFTYLSFWIGYLLGNRVITASDYIRDEFLKVPFLSKRQFIRVYNCVNVEKFDRSDVGIVRTQVAMVATLENHKDHTTLLKAWVLVEQKSPHYSLVLAGDGSLRNQLTEMSKQLGLKTVRFVGSVQDVSSLLNQSEIFVLSTTTQEGFGTVLIEALAARCKVVASDVPACREILQDGRFGVLVPPQNETALASAILSEMVRNCTEDQIDGAIQYAKEFSPKRMLSAYIQIAYS